jgi:hypothetical protein
MEKMEDDLKKTEGFLLAYNQSTKINPIGCDTIVNSPSFFLFRLIFELHKLDLKKMEKMEYNLKENRRLSFGILPINKNQSYWL